MTTSSTHLMMTGRSTTGSQVRAGSLLQEVFNQLLVRQIMCLLLTGHESPPPEYNTEVLGMMQVYAQASDKHRQNSQPSITKHDIFTEKS